MIVKSLEQLQKLRDEYKKSLSLREQGEHEGDQIELRLGLGTSGINEIARDTFQALLEEIEKHNMTNIKIVGVGSLGDAANEPIVEVRKPEKQVLTYGPITRENACEFIEKHVLNDDHEDKRFLIKNTEKAEV